jgi:hypothetical protein
MRLVGYFWHLQKSHFRWVGGSEWLARARPQELGGTCGWERESGELSSSCPLLGSERGGVRFFSEW